MVFPFPRTGGSPSSSAFPVHIHTTYTDGVGPTGDRSGTTALIIIVQAAILYSVVQMPMALHNTLTKYNNC